MTSLVLKFKLLDNRAKLPSYSHKTDAGFDLFTPQKIVVKKRRFELISLGIASEIPKNSYVQIFGKSGLSAKGLHLMGGVIDSGYRGEWKVIIANLGKKDYKFLSGDKVAQGILLPARQAKIIEVKKLKDSDRGKNGFGSTGK